MALLAQRFDTVSDDLRRVARRLGLEIDGVALNPVDHEFSVGRFQDRSALVRARLRQLGNETSVDAGLLAASAQGGEMIDGHHWLESLQVLASGWDSIASIGSACAGVARGLTAFVGAVVAPLRTEETSDGALATISGDVNSTAASTRSGLMVDDRMASKSGGLFLTVSTSGDDDVAYLGGRLGDLARHAGGSATTSARPTSATNDGPDWTHVWDEISNDTRPD